MEETQKQEIILILKDDKTVKTATYDIFNKIDTDKSGLIDKEEFSKALLALSQSLGFPEPSEHEISETIKAIDQNGDGLISREEMEELIRFLFDIIIKDLETS